MPYVVAIDQGTTGSTALVLDQQLRVRGRADRGFAQHYPRPGEVEHDCDEIWQSVLDALAKALAQADGAWRIGQELIRLGENGA